MSVYMPCEGEVIVLVCIDKDNIVAEMAAYIEY